jgi:hypothetical protein
MSLNRLAEQRVSHFDDSHRAGENPAEMMQYVPFSEYLWAAAWCFFAEGTPAAEEWVRDRALAVLEGNAKAVAAGIRRRLTAENVAKSKRKKAEDAARYLTNNAAYLDYPTALAQGLPIATGIIEGT